MLDHGHPNALSYPIWKVFAEASLVVRRINAQLAAEVSLLQLALSSIPNKSVKPAATRNAAQALKQQLKELTDGE